MAQDTDTTVLPVHVGYIIDGNRRWAKQHGLPAYEGHLAGYETIKEVLLETLHRGVQYASAYVFSTENWKRSADEVNKLMSLLLRILKDDIHLFIDNNVRLRVIGTHEGLSDKLVAALQKAEQETAHLTGGELLLCLNYGGQLEIAEACQKIIASGARADLVTPELIAQHLYAPEVPACDIIVRTSGEQRLSNFMLWRAAYSELMFVDKNWPDMRAEDVDQILDEYAARNRRFGG